jgi:hypothetical protein
MSLGIAGHVEQRLVLERFLSRPQTLGAVILFHVYHLFLASDDADRHRVVVTVVDTHKTPRGARHNQVESPVAEGHRHDGIGDRGHITNESPIPCFTGVPFMPLPFKREIIL